ncbi:CD9 antigen-like [Scomber japonicus]|uniref:CD9 antigen-like n=1 Tax=Scomber japonicus TaxID=13676 RepID=UPI002306BDAB|nr:CD9 antigen-like [Scomber japonicus]
MSALSSWELCVKYALFIFNFVFWPSVSGRDPEDVSGQNSSLFLLIIFAVEVAAGIWGLSNKEKVVEEVTEFYKQTYNNYKDTKQDALKETLRLIHFGLDCCGPTGTVIDAAKDICPKKEGLEVLITTSCPAAIDEMFNTRLHIIGGVGIGIGVIMIFGMIFSMMLCCAIKKSRDYV